MNQSQIQADKDEIRVATELSRLDFRFLDLCPLCGSPIEHLATCDVCPQCGSLAGCWD